MIRMCTGTYDVPYVFFVSGRNDVMLVIALNKKTWLPLPVSICLFCENTAE